MIQNYCLDEVRKKPLIRASDSIQATRLHFGYISKLSKVHFGSFVYALLLIGSMMILLWNYGKTVEYIPCFNDCGETFIAQKQVNNFNLYAFKYGLLEDHATSNNLEAHPYLYTHNASIPAILFPLVDWMGLKSFLAKQCVTLLIFGIGLFYAFISILYYTRSYLMACSLLLFLCTNYVHVFGFGLNALRAWHFLVLFGLLYHTGQYIFKNAKFQWIDRCLIGIFAVLAFGIGYDFWIICFFVLFFLLFLVLITRQKTAKVLFVDLMLIGTFFFIPVVLRQIHVIAVLGFDFWYHDFIYTAAIKVPFLKNAIALPAMNDIELYYTQYNILRPPATPAESLSNIYNTLVNMIMNITIPSFGIVTITSGALVFGFALFFVLHIMFNYNKFCIFFSQRIMFLCKKAVILHIGSTWLTKCLKISKLFMANQTHKIINMFNSFQGILILFFALTAGSIIGIFIFAPLSLHIYFKHQFPLLVFPLTLAKAMFFSGTVLLCYRLYVRRAKLFLPTLCLPLFFLLDHAIVQVNNVNYFRPISTSWISAVKDKKDATYAVSWISDVVAAFTDNWVVGFLPGIENKIIDRLQKGKMPFQFSDYFLFGQKDVSSKGAMYLQPDYWLYFPIEQANYNQFDSPFPTYYRDYLTKFFSEFFQTEPKIISLYSINGNHFTSGGYIVLYGRLSTSNYSNIKKIELVSDGKFLMDVDYNYIYGVFTAVYHTPENYKSPNFPMDVIAIFDDDSKKLLKSFNFENKPGHKIELADIDAGYFKRKQMTVEEIIAANPNLTIAERGLDYVIFDMRQTYQRFK